MNLVNFDVIPIISVPHTGTNSVIELFKNKGYNEIPLREVRNLDKTKTNLISGHIERRNVQFIKDLKDINNISQVIVPMRDPLLSLLSAYHRKEGMGDMLTSWDLWIEHVHILNPFYVPVDLDVSSLVYRDIKFEDIGLYGYRGEYGLKRAYYDRNLEAIVRKLRGNIKSLQDKEFVFRPILEKLGYKNLLWWS